MVIISNIFCTISSLYLIVSREYDCPPVFYHLFFKDCGAEKIESESNTFEKYKKGFIQNRKLKDEVKICSDNGRKKLQKQINTFIVLLTLI